MGKRAAHRRPLLPPRPSSTTVSKIMRANRSRDTSPEIALRRAFRSIGIRGARYAYKGAPGRPDIAYPRERVAVFVHGCFWHRCPMCRLPLPKSNVAYWREKFWRNKERDRRKRKELERAGWRVFEVWECDIREDSRACASIIFSNAWKKRRD